MFSLERSSLFVKNLYLEPELSRYCLETRVKKYGSCEDKLRQTSGDKAMLSSMLEVMFHDMNSATSLNFCCVGFSVSLLFLCRSQHLLFFM